MAWNKILKMCPRSSGSKVELRNTFFQYFDRSGEVGWGSVDWIDLTQDRDEWKAVANVMTFRVR
jgi:hypothetical protein